MEILPNSSDLIHMYMQEKVDKKDIQKSTLGWLDELWCVTGLCWAPKKAIIAVLCSSYNKEMSNSEYKTAITAAAAQTLAVAPASKDRRLGLKNNSDRSFSKGNLQ